MTSDWWTHFALAAAMSAAIMVNFLNLRRVRRLRNQLEAERAEVIGQLQRAAAEWTEAVEVHKHADELATLLGELCVHACGRDTAPVWRAWALTMGSLKVQVQGERGTWVVDISERSDELSRSD